MQWTDLSIRPTKRSDREKIKTNEENFINDVVARLNGGQPHQERKYSTFYYQRATLFEELPVTSKDIIFLGNSITNGGEWSELLNNKHVKNRGISGDICMGVYDRLDAILKGKPAKIFLLIGINDVSRGTSADTIVHRIGMITQKIKQESPKQSYICKVYFR